MPRKQDDNFEGFYLLSKYRITLIRWDDEWGHWRLGLNWNGKDDYFYIVEMPTIKECIDEAVNFVREHGEIQEEE